MTTKTGPGLLSDQGIAEPTYHFMGWRAEPSRNLLLRGGFETRITPRSMEVLEYFLNSGGRVVSKEELLREVWKGQAVTDDALVVTIYELRKALGDQARQPTFLETVPRRGYRFIPEVETKVAEGPASGEAVGPPPSPIFPHRRLGLAILGLAVASGTVIALGTLRTEDPSVETRPRKLEARNLADPRVDALFAEARKRLDLRTATDLDLAERAYRDLLARLPEDDRAAGHRARAEAGLARVAVSRADLRLGDRFGLYHQARSRAEKALAIDPLLAEAHLALGTTRFLLDWDLERSIDSLDRALQVAPEDPDTHQVLAWALSVRGDHAAAEVAARRAVDLDPRSASRRADLAFLLLVAGQHQTAIDEAEAALVLDPANVSAFTVLFRAHLARSDEASARDTLVRLFPPREDSDLEALAELDVWQLLEIVMRHMPPEQGLTVRAGLRARAGAVDQALAALDLAFAQRDWEVLWLEHLPELEDLRQEERFRALLLRRDSRASSG